MFVLMFGFNTTGCRFFLRFSIQQLQKTTAAKVYYVSIYFLQKMHYKNMIYAEEVINSTLE